VTYVADEYRLPGMVWTSADTVKISSALEAAPVCLSWGYPEGHFIKHFELLGEVEHMELSIVAQEALNYGRKGDRVPLKLDHLLMMSGLRVCGAFHDSRHDVGDETTFMRGLDRAARFVYRE
jgi:hypothetical protein